VSPELIDASNAGEKWQEPFDAPVTDVFRVQADIATRVAQALQLAITPLAQQTLSEAPTTNLDAYDAYVRAEALMTITDEKQMRDAIALYRRAVAFDSNYALAYAGLGAALSVVYGNFDPDSSLLREAKTAIDHALRLAPRAAEAVLAQGAYYEATRNLTAAADRYRAAYQLDPNFARALFWAGDIESYAGNWKEALEDYKRAVALNPGDWGYHSRAGSAYQSLGQYAAAEREYDRALALAPHLPFPYHDKAIFLIQARGDTAGARRLYDTAVVQCGSERFATTIAYNWGVPIRMPDAMALVTVGAFGRDTAGYYMLRGAYYRSRGASDRAHAYADSARVRFERMEAAGLESAQLHAMLALMYDYLGRPHDAMREMDAATQVPATSGGQTDLMNYLRAYVLARSGHVPQALADLKGQIDHPPAIPTRAQLRVDPNWDFLRNDPRFQRLIADSAGNGSS